MPGGLQLDSTLPRHARLSAPRHCTPHPPAARRPLPITGAGSAESGVYYSSPRPGDLHSVTSLHSSHVTSIRPLRFTRRTCRSRSRPSQPSSTASPIGCAAFAHASQSTATSSRARGSSVFPSTSAPPHRREVSCGSLAQLATFRVRLSRLLPTARTKQSGMCKLLHRRIILSRGMKSIILN